MQLDWMFFVSLIATATPAQTPSAKPAKIPSTVQLWQRSEVKQGTSAVFDVEIDPEETNLPITLEIHKELGTGEAAFEDGMREKQVNKTQEVRIMGLVASELPGALSLVAWRAGTPLTRIYFDVIASQPEPRIYLVGRDITGKTEEVAAGQQVTLTVVLHPSLKIQK